jgi:hypothetical protein
MLYSWKTNTNLQSLGRILVFVKPFQITIIVHISIIITANCNINSLKITEPHNGNIKCSISAVSSKLTLHMNRGYWLYVINTIFKTTMYFGYIVVVSFILLGTQSAHISSTWGKSITNLITYIWSTPRKGRH